MKVGAFAAIAFSSFTVGAPSKDERWFFSSPTSPTYPKDTRQFYVEDYAKCSGDLFQKGVRLLINKNSRKSACHSLIGEIATKTIEIPETVDATTVFMNTVTAEPLTLTATE